MSAVIGQKAPNLGVSEWIQGAPTNFDQEKDHVVQHMSGRQGSCCEQVPGWDVPCHR